MLFQARSAGRIVLVACELFIFGMAIFSLTSLLVLNLVNHPFNGGFSYIY
jgi:hypothetical protein